MNSSHLLTLTDSISSVLESKDQDTFRSELQDFHEKITEILLAFQREEDSSISKYQYRQNLCVSKALVYEFYQKRFQEIVRSLTEISPSIEQNFFHQIGYEQTLPYLPKELYKSPKKMELDLQKLNQLIQGNLLLSSWENTILTFRMYGIETLSLDELEKFLRAIAGNQVVSLTNFSFQDFPRESRALWYDHFSQCQVIALNEIPTTELSKEESTHFFRCITDLKGITITNTSWKNISLQTRGDLLTHLRKLLDLTVDVSVFDDLKIVPPLPNLRSLALQSISHGCHNLEGLHFLFQSISHLRYLSVLFSLQYYCTDQYFDTLFEPIQHLEQLDILHTDFSQIPPDKIYALFSSFANLKQMNLRKSNFQDMTDFQIKAMFDPLPSLQKVFVSCSGFMLERIIALCPHLQGKIFKD